MINGSGRKLLRSTATNTFSNYFARSSFEGFCNFWGIYQLSYQEPEQQFVWCNPKPLVHLQSHMPALLKQIWRNCVSWNHRRRFKVEYFHSRNTFFFVLWVAKKKTFLFLETCALKEIILLSLFPKIWKTFYIFEIDLFIGNNFPNVSLK